MLIGAAYAISERASQRGDTTPACAGLGRHSVEAGAKQPERYYHNCSSDDGLRNPQNYSDSKERPASRTIAHSFRARDECGDRVVDAKNTDLADDVSRRPSNGEYAECRRSEQPRNEKREYPAEIRS